MDTTLSVIIPTLNEAATITAVIDAIDDQKTTEILVVDGGSTDNTCELATKAGARVLHTPPGRAKQMNAGADLAIGNILLFLHGDTLLPEGNNHLIEQTLQMPEVSCGAFSLYIDSARWSLRCISAGANLRSKVFQLPYGDQGLFTTTENFQAVGRFPELPIMEDYYFVRSLAKKGKIITLPQAVTTSSRRWDNMGIFKTTLINQLIIIGHMIGTPPLDSPAYISVQKELTKTTMLDRVSLKLLNKPLHQGALTLSRCNISADQLTLSGFAVGLLAIPLLWAHCYLAALAAILANRLADGLDGPLARLTRPTEGGAFLDIVLDFLFYAAVVFGFGLSNPTANSLAASFLLFSFMGTSASFLAFSIMAERFQLVNLRLPNKGFYYLGGLAEGTETLFFLLSAACFQTYSNLLPGFSAAVAFSLHLCVFSMVIKYAKIERKQNQDNKFDQQKSRSNTNK